jgi:bifunctional DNase/RNase
MLVEVRVKCVIREPIASRYVLILETIDGGIFLPISIGVFEAEAIYVELNKIIPPRPMTFDFITGILAALNDVKIEKIVIYDVLECIYKAKLQLMHNDKLLDIECRPSDAIALGLRLNTAVYVEDKVLKNNKCICKEKLNLKEKSIIKNILIAQRSSWNS